jgi:DNA-nicking Smr family endonuclease
MSRDRRRVLSDDERVLWTAVTQQIKPLTKDAAAAEPAAADEIAAKPAPKSAPSRARPAIVRPSLPPAPTAPPLTPLSRRERTRVARGKMEIDGRIDLHGLTQDRAHGALLNFLRAASAREARLVLVITGKGTRDGERGVLRRQVPQWLSLPDFRAYVIGFEDAHIAHGGEGALYVRVRRAR